MIKVVRAPEVNKSWNRFVEHHPRATVAHLAGWGEIAREVYGHESIYLTAQDGDGDVVGVLPLILVRSRLFGRRLVSMPFLDYGGVLAEPVVAWVFILALGLLGASLFNLAREVRLGLDELELYR